MTAYQGKYRIRHPVINLFRPKLLLYEGRKNGKPKGLFKILRYQKRLRILKVNDNELFLQMKLDFIEIDVILRIEQDGTINGFLDTPIGNYHFRGNRMET